MGYIKHYINSYNLRIISTDLTEITQSVQKLHKLSAFSATILSKVFLNTVLLAKDFKNKESISLQWQTNSPLGIIFADAYNVNYLRGYIKTSQENLIKEKNEKEFLAKYKGILSINKYSLLKHSFKSIIKTTENSIDKIFTDFTIKSEQIESEFHTNVDTNINGQITKASGFLIQLLPQGNMKKFKEINELYKNQTLDELIKKENFELIYETKIKYKCTCSREKVFSSLKLLSQSEQNELLKRGAIEITCNGCGKNYNFTKNDILNLIKTENNNE